MNLFYLVFIIILCFILYNYFSYNLWSERLPTYTIDNTYESAKTGDLILFRWHSVDIFHEMISPFTHVGMVVELNHQKYILETHSPGDTLHMGYETGGVHLYPLKQRISMYKGSNFLLKLNKNYNISIDENMIVQYYSIPFYDKYRQHYTEYCLPKKICNECISSKKLESMFCSQFIGFLLQETGILDKNVNIDCLIPNDFITIQNKNGKLYNELYKITK
jgi:hypothetical protein